MKGSKGNGSQQAHQQQCYAVWLAAESDPRSVIPAAAGLHQVGLTVKTQDSKEFMVTETGLQRSVS